MEIEKKDLFADLAKPESKPFQNEGKTGNSSAQEYCSSGPFYFLLSRSFLLLHVTTAKGLRIYRRVEHVPQRKNGVNHVGKVSIGVMHSSVCVQMRLNWGDQQPKKDSSHKLTT